MQIQSFNIERFGRKQNLFVDGIADQLNVVYGPNGSGKSTAVQFLRWMLYGNCDEKTGRYVSDLDRTSTRTTPGTAAGTLSFMENGRRRAMSRHDDGSRYGRVALDGGNHYAKQANHLVSLLGDISQTEFDLMFAPDLDREHGLSALLQSSFARGIDLTSQRIPSERVQELRLRIDEYRSEMDRLPFTSGDLSVLLDRKRAVERKIDEMEHETRRRRDDYDREFQEVSRRIQDIELEIDRLRTDWHSRDEQVASRRRELEEAWRVADQAKQEYLARRRNELAEIEANVSRARSMQADVRRRRDRLETTLRDANFNIDKAPHEVAETVCLVQSIARQLDDIKTLDQTSAESSTPYRSVYRYHGSPPATSTSIDALRAQVGRLCDTLQHERSEDRVRTMAAELDELRQTDGAMDRWVRGLVEQKNHVQRELDDAQRFGISLMVDRARKGSDSVPGFDLDDSSELQLLDTLQTGRIRAVGHTCDGYEPVHPEHDPLLRQLIQQRDAAHESLQATERELRHLMDRRRDLETAIARLAVQDLEMARRELAEVESLIRAAEERDRILREISRLEEEIARLRDSVRNSPVTQHAVRILRRLTRGRYTNVRIDNTRDVSVEDSSETMVPVEHLSRGLRDQVYLSFCLAILTAYRQRGVELPFVLNDGFTNVDSEKDDTLGAVLREFADSGQQVIVLTRHHYVANLLRNLGARYLELGASKVAAAPVAEVDHVRFRPQSDSGATTYRPIEDYPPTTTRAAVPQKFAYPTYTEPVIPTQHVSRPPAPVPTSFVNQHVPRPVQQPRPRSVWDDGVSEHYSSNYSSNYTQRPTTPTTPTMNTAFTNQIVTENRAAANVPFENMMLTNEAPAIRSISTTAPRVPAAYAPAPQMPAHVPTLPRTVSPSAVAKTVTTVDRVTRSTPLEATGTVDSSSLSRLRAIGVVTVHDFLQLSAAVAEDELRKWGLDQRPIRRWQDQLTLRCELDGVSADDARLLVACGVCGIQDLAEADLDVLCERIGHLLSTQRTRSRGRSAMRLGSYPRERVSGWIRMAREVWARMHNGRGNGNGRGRGNGSQTRADISPPYESEYDPDYVYNDPDRPTGYPTSPRPGRSTNKLDRAEYDGLDVEREYDNDGYYSDNDDDGIQSDASQRSARSSRSSRSRSNSGSSRSSSRSTRSGSRRSGSGSSSSSRSTRRTSSRSERPERAERSERAPRESRSSRSRSRSESKTRELKFYLDSADPVVDAPTIGPKTAKKLHAIGIHTVSDLLTARPGTIADQLDDNRVDAETVQQWMDQATLACRIPQIRGHDAQILVACGITEPTKLANMTPDALWKIVQPFTKTSECKRIIRNGKAPDKDEIRDWIEWAESSRTLQAA